MNLAEVYPKAVQQQVAFVPGNFFFTEPGAGLNTMRLNFTMPTPDEIQTAIRTLAALIRTLPRERPQERIRERRRAAE
jgi:DNA-binding transcriptional MocR family regulator